MDFNQIQDLIKLVAKTGVSEVKIDQGDLKLTINYLNFFKRIKADFIRIFF